MDLTDTDVELIVAIRNELRSGAARSHREAAGGKRSEVAAVAGVTEQAVARWETAQRMPRTAAALRVAPVYAHFRSCVGANQ